MGPQIISWLLLHWIHASLLGRKWAGPSHQLGVRGAGGYMICISKTKFQPYLCLHPHRNFPLRQVGTACCKDSGIWTAGNPGSHSSSQTGTGATDVREASVPVLNYIFCMVLYMVNTQPIKMQENKWSVRTKEWEESALSTLNRQFL